MGRVIHYMIILEYFPLWSLVSLLNFHYVYSGISNWLIFASNLRLIGLALSLPYFAVWRHDFWREVEHPEDKVENPKHPPCFSCCVLLTSLPLPPPTCHTPWRTPGYSVCILKVYSLCCQALVMWCGKINIGLSAN